MDYTYHDQPHYPDDCAKLGPESVFLGSLEVSNYRPRMSDPVQDAPTRHLDFYRVDKYTYAYRSSAKSFLPTRLYYTADLLEMNWDYRPPREITELIVEVIQREVSIYKQANASEKYRFFTMPRLLERPQFVPSLLMNSDRAKYVEEVAEMIIDRWLNHLSLLNTGDLVNKIVTELDRKGPIPEHSLGGSYGSPDTQ